MSAAPSADDLDRAGRLADAVADGARKAIEKLEEEGTTFGSVKSALGVLGGIALRSLLTVVEKAGPIAADVLADSAISWLKSQAEDQA